MENRVDAIRLENVSFSVDNLQILKNITGSFPEGEITTIVGPSGSGKTTVFRLCNGLKSPTSGQISIYGKPIESFHPVELRRTVGTALQKAPMISGTVKENLELPFTLQGKSLQEEVMHELLEDVGLDKDFLHRESKDLSGGQRQKLSIARTLVNQPKILLLDEITSSLDRVSQQDIEELIVEINRKYEVTIIWITHNLKQALEIGSYTWVLMDGELVESGTSELLNNPKSDKVKQFLMGEVE